MDKTLIWLLVPGALAIFAYYLVSARYKHLSYDLEEYLLAGKRLPRGRFILATTTISLLGLMALPHMGLFYRSGFSYGFAALAVIIVPLISALFARRLWILGRVFSPLTPAQLIGDYYRSNGMRVLTAVISVLVALSLTVMSLRFGAGLMEGLLGGGSATISRPEASFDISSWIAPLTMTVMAAILFFHTAYGGMGAVLRMAAPVGIFLVFALVLGALVSIDALGGFESFFGHLGTLQTDQTTAPLFTQGRFFDTLPAAAPANMAWPGLMVISGLIALAGLASTPATLMVSFTAAKGQSHAPAQFIATALITGLVLLTTTIMMALLGRLAGEMAGISTDTVTNTVAPLTAGHEPQMIMSLLSATPLGAPLLLVLITLALIAGLIASAAASLMTAGGMISNDIFYQRLKNTNRPTYQKSITRSAIAVLLLVALAISWTKPEDPLPLFLLAGAFGVQLLPALVGLCYFEKLSSQSILNGAIAGLIAVVLTSTVPQGLADFFGITLPYGAWPLSLHPAFWGLAANLTVMFIAHIKSKAMRGSKDHKQALAHQLSFHVLPDGQPLMAPDAPKWQFIALLIGALFAVVTFLPFTGMTFPHILPSVMPSLWSWQFLSWFIGLALVYVVAYRLQPTFDPEQAHDGSFNHQRRRFRVKARTRRTSEALTTDTPAHETEPGQHDIET